jgi:hypothetical protein
MSRVVSTTTRIAFLGALIAAVALLEPVSAQPPAEGGAEVSVEASDEPADDEPEDVEEIAMRLGRALSRRLTVWVRPSGRVTYVSHCRRAAGGCPARVAALSRYMAEVSHDKGLDPFILAAMAIRESGLDPFVRGAAGEYGIVQLHPRGIGGHVRFVQNERYRNRCRRRPGACQREVLEVGANHLAQAIAYCGSLNEALGRYNRGICGETAYTRRVMREHARLLDLVKTETTAVATNDG